MWVVIPLLGAALSFGAVNDSSVFRVALAIVFLGVMAFFHELGHFLAGKRFGVFVHEFGLGFGPSLVSFKLGETRYSLKLFPLGGFVRFAGEAGGGLSREDSAVPVERRFYSQPALRKSVIVAAGPVMNLLLAAFLFFLVFSVTGLDRTTPFIGEVIPGKPAAQGGMLPGDRIVAVEGQPVQKWEDMVAVVRRRPGLPTRFVVERNGRQLELVITPESVNGVGLIGVQSRLERSRMHPVEGIVSAFKETVYVVTFWVKGLVETIAGKVRPEITGPVGISQILGEAASAGIAPFLYLLGAISANLGLINLLPIPALDGSRLLFAAIEGVRGKPVDPEKENFIHFIGFAILMALFVIITYRDIMRLIM
ncbi:MAG TPA: RIP metalloprotease RseP [Firmicutes bacterium]|nr:RIP metalloprotease RseP [Candidatus Fermentithermobacillaceae bacterium]